MAGKLPASKLTAMRGDGVLLLMFLVAHRLLLPAHGYVQVASMNVNRERQEVAKRKQSQLASSSLLGILPAAAAAGSARSQSSSSSPDRPASPCSRMLQQQLQQPGCGLPCASTSSRPASAQSVPAYVGLEGGNSWAISTHSGSGAGGSNSSSPPRGHTGSPTHQQRQNSGQLASSTAVPAVARPGSLAAAVNTSIVSAAAGAGAAKSAYQAYEERAVGASSKRAGQGA
jgi:hypothetical protein